MKITGIETFVVDAGWRPWQFVAVRTDAGITGYGECSDGRNPYGVVSTVHDFEAVLLGQDPRPVEMRYWDLYRASRQSPGGIFRLPASQLRQARSVTRTAAAATAGDHPARSRSARIW